MKRVKISTDSNSCISIEEAKKFDVSVIAMPVIMDGKVFFENVDITKEEFEKKLLDGTNITTSQPSVTEVENFWDGLLSDCDELVHIPMSSGLSESCNTAKSLAKSDKYKGRVFVVDNMRVSISQFASIIDAVNLRDDGLSGKEIMEKMEASKDESKIFVVIDTLKYLVKGGRIKPSAAMVAKLINIKPILLFYHGILESHDKTIGKKAALKKIITFVKEYMDTDFKNIESEYIRIGIICTSLNEETSQFKELVEKSFPNYIVDIKTLPISILTHTGPGVLSLGVTKQITKQTVK